VPDVLQDLRGTVAPQPQEVPDETRSARIDHADAYDLHGVAV
jgi:hypothetical protein